MNPLRRFVQQSPIPPFPAAGPNDAITGNGGNDYILAGAGTDVVTFTGNRADYTITTSGLRTDVTDRLGRDGHDILAHAEVLRFADGDWLL